MRSSDATVERRMWMPRYPDVTSEITPLSLTPGASGACALRTLGAIELRFPDGEQARTVLAQPKRLALLVYLAMAPGFVRRDTLLPLFWGEYDTAHGRTALRQAVHFLRRALGPDVIIGRGAEELATDAAAVALDATRFEQSLRTGALADALALYRGDFLCGFFVSGGSTELETWIEGTRVRLRERATRTAVALSAREEREHPDSSLHWARYAAALAPDDEAVQRRLITLLDASGDPAGALHTYESLRHRLATDYEIEPAPETASVAAAIRSRRAPERSAAAEAKYRGARNKSVPAAPSPRSIAVLPLAFTGPTTEQLLGEGVSEDIRQALRAIDGLHVLSRLESEDASGQPADISTLHRLGVSAVLSGEIERTGSLLRMHVRLTQLADERVLWRDIYERDARDLFAMARRLVQAIAAALRIALADETTERILRTPTADVEAYNLYLQGRRHWNNRRDALAALEYFQLALARDPMFALAYVGVADAYNTLGSWETAQLPAWEAFPRAQAAAAKALELDPKLPEALASLAYGQSHYLWRWEQAEREITAALALRPSYSHGHHWHSHLLMALGRVDESFVASERARALDPCDVIINAHVAWHHWCAREWDLAVDASMRTTSLAPEDHWAPCFLGLALVERGETADAVGAFRRALVLSGESPAMLGALGWGLAVAGDRRAARVIARTLQGIAETRHIATYETAMIHVALGETDAAFDWLDRAYEERAAWLTYLRVDPRLDPIRGDPRFGVLARAVGHAAAPAVTREA